MYSAGSDELAKAIQKSNDAYSKQMAELSTKGVKFETEAIMGAYSEEFAKASEQFGNSFDFNGFWQTMQNKIANGENLDTEEITNSLNKSLEWAINNTNISNASRKHIGELFEMMLPSVETLRETMSRLEKIPNMLILMLKLTGLEF